jgi:aspartyl-tRNA synthetase
MRIPIQSVTPASGQVEVCGWVHEVRDLGGLAFFLIRDRTGIIQVTIPKKRSSDAVIAAAKHVSRESVVRVAGIVKASTKLRGRELVQSGWDHQSGRQPSALML